MSEYTITIADANHDAGITFAREQRNRDLPRDENGEPVGAFATNQEYLQWLVAETWVPSYTERMHIARAQETLTTAVETGEVKDLDALRVAINKVGTLNAEAIARAEAAENAARETDAAKAESDARAAAAEAALAQAIAAKEAAEAAQRAAEYAKAESDARAVAAEAEREATMGAPP